MDIPNLELFIPESVAVMRHKPGWGLGRHYDNAQDENTGIVLLITISENDIIPRKFNFVDAPRGKGTVVIFPSYMMHRVSEVTKGTRESLVLWVGGDHYR